MVDVLEIFAGVEQIARKLLQDSAISLACRRDWRQFAQEGNSAVQKSVVFILTQKGVVNFGHDDGGEDQHVSELT